MSYLSVIFFLAAAIFAKMWKQEVRNREAIEEDRDYWQGEAERLKVTNVEKVETIDQSQGKTEYNATTTSGTIKQAGEINTSD